jgi:predicted Zn-dependent peptidase
MGEQLMARYKIGRPFSGYEYTRVEADSFEEALELANDFGQYWNFDPETHLLEEGDIQIRNTETLEDRTY